MKLSLSKFICFILLLVSGCVSINTNKNISDMDGQVYWLNQSIFSGSFYGYPKINLIDSRPFKYINDAKTVDNLVIYLKNETEIVPLGTMVKIERIEYPTFINLLKRPIYSPRDNIWVYLKIGKRRGQTNIFREKDFILLIPKKISDDAAVKKYLENFLTKEDPNPWVLTQREYIQKAIWDKKPVLGMNKKQLSAALGTPLKIEFIKKDSAFTGDEVWHYHQNIVIFEDEKIIKISSISSK